MTQEVDNEKKMVQEVLLLPIQLGRYLRGNQPFRINRRKIDFCKLLQPKEPMKILLVRHINLSIAQNYLIFNKNDFFPLRYKKMTSNRIEQMEAISTLITKGENFLMYISIFPFYIFRVFNFSIIFYLGDMVGSPYSKWHKKSIMKRKWLKKSYCYQYNQAGILGETSHSE